MIKKDENLTFHFNSFSEDEFYKELEKELKENGLKKAISKFTDEINVTVCNGDYVSHMFILECLHSICCLAEIQEEQIKTILRLLHDSGGCGAKDEWTIGHDSAVDNAICTVENVTGIKVIDVREERE